MSSKNSSLKENILWYKCEKCSIHITLKDLESHEKNCPEIKEINSYISNGKFFTSEIKIKSSYEDLKNISKRQINNLIFLSESVIRLCGWKIGDRLEIVIPELSKEVASIVRTVWPIEDAHLSTVFVSEDDHKHFWSKHQSKTFMINGEISSLMSAKKIEIAINEETDIGEEVWEDLRKVLKAQTIGNVYCKNNKIVVKFFGKEYEFQIKCLKSYEKDSKELEDVMSKLEIGDGANDFFIITPNTEFVVVDKKVVGGLTKDKSSPERNKKLIIGGVNSIVNELMDLMNMALGLREIKNCLKITRGVLLHGPSGCGKSLLCDFMATQMPTADIIKINSAQVFSKYFGETEATLCKYFDRAYKNFPKPTIIIIEEINNLCPKYDQTNAIKRISTTLFNLLDNLYYKPEARHLFIIAATNNLENINPALRRNGRLDYEIEIPVPSPDARFDILLKLLQNIPNCLTENGVREVANATHGFVGADLTSLLYRATIIATKRNVNCGNFQLSLTDISSALEFMKPSAMREVLIEVPNVKWEDIGGQHDLKLKLRQAIEWPLSHPEMFTRLGIKPPRGVLMFGPPGCSKTMIAKALATESKINFLSIKGPELFSMWVGESERAVRELFRKARSVAPSIIFFDEIDAIGGERAASGDTGGSSVKERVLAQLLTEMDGVTALNNVIIVAATNRPDLMDKALLRPGRIDRLVYVTLPNAETRLEIFKIKLKQMPLSDDVYIDELVKLTEGYSGAEIQAVCHEAAMKALEESFNANIISGQHFEHSLKVVRPRTSLDLLQIYDTYLSQF